MKSKALIAAVIAAVAALLSIGLGAIAPAAASAQSPGTNVWVGNIAQGSNITGVSGSWTVPATPTEPGATLFTWIGLGGYGTPGMLQEGVTSELAPAPLTGVATTVACTPYSSAWWFALNGSQGYPANWSADVSDVVRPGDQMQGSITANGPGTWKMQMTDLTQGWKWSGDEAWPVSTESAEWVVEFYTGLGLPPFSTTFSNTSLSGTASSVGSLVAGGATVSCGYPVQFTIQYSGPFQANPDQSEAGNPACGDAPATATTTTTASIPKGEWWTVTPGGVVTAHGLAHYYGSLANLHRRFAGSVVAAATTPNGKGYWLVTKQGGVFSFGNARYYGSITGVLARLHQRFAGAVTAAAATPNGKGYWLVGHNGHVYAFGDAHYYGSVTSRMPLASPIVGIAPTPHGKGYWLTTKVGTVFAFGDAHYYGSVSRSQADSERFTGRVVAITPSPDGKGYCLVTSGGATFAFGNGRTIANNASMMTDNYWQGQVYTFGGA
jgi:hypothetical protein